MRLTLLGVASFHRACLLAQDFTHEPACQTGDSAPQGRFRHQPEQMVHPPFAWQLASFPSLPVCGEEAPYCPLRDFATQISSSEIGARQNRLGERHGDAIKHPKLIGHSIFGKVLKTVGRQEYFPYQINQNTMLQLKKVTPVTASQGNSGSISPTLGNPVIQR